MEFKQIVKEYFSFTRSERNGIYLLLVIILIISLIMQTMHVWLHPKVASNKSFVTKIKTLEASLKKDTNYYVNRLDQYIIDRYDTLKLFRFNPNSTSTGEWKQLGLTDKQIKTIENYITNGGKFFTKRDFQRIYGIRTKQYEILKPYIDLPDEKQFDNDDYKNEGLSNKPQPQKLFIFDPNTTTDNEWKQLGLTNPQIQTINNYLKSGGRFYKKSDLQKIYGIPETHYKMLEPYIQITESAEKTLEKTVDIQIIELNSANKNDLKQIPGIGDYYAMQIIKYRNKLGGFYSKKQISEVYKLPDNVSRTVQQYSSIDEEKITKLNINYLEFKELLKHPYLDYEDVKKIVNYRRTHGTFIKIQQLYENKLLSKEKYERIKHYLTTR